ncbi:hypothetical protein C1646_749677 [Rhizophagus diaphanus]|nr:hypothetical protein C1646_749677 [Rhizophagus diaphanus] [Rhizophagus sp. MUCL 43196]
MSCELELSKQRIIELEAKNDKLKAEIAELRKGNTEIHDLRIKLSISDAEIAELKRRNAEFLKANEEYNERRDAENAKFKTRIEKLESDSPNFNSVAVLEVITVPTNFTKRFNGKLLEEKDMDSFFLEAHKKIDDVKHQEPISSGCSLCKLFHEIEILATVYRPKYSSSLLDLAKLFDKASDAKYRTKKANEEEILCWVNFGKEFMVHFSELVENSNGKIREKKAKGIIYNEMLKHLVTIREKRSKEMGIQLPKISRNSLTRRTQRSIKLVKIFEKIGINKIKYLSTYSFNSISELTNDQIQEIIEASERRDNSAEQNDFPTPEISARNLKTSEKILPEENLSLSADLEDYIKMLTRSLNDETRNGKLTVNYNLVI